MSLCAIAVMGILFLSETIAFARTIMETSIALDENDQPQIRLNFNITLMDLHCDYVSVGEFPRLGLPSPQNEHTRSFTNFPHGIGPKMCGILLAPTGRT